MARFALAALVALVVSSTACVSFFQPHALDIGRGAQPMKPGQASAHGGVAGGFPGGLGGFGVEGQVADDLAVGFDVISGAQDSAVGTIIPSGTYFTGQYNPQGFDNNLAIRASGGMGVDLMPNAKDIPSAPWLGGTIGVVTSTELGPLVPYLQLTGGARRYVGGPDALIVTVKKINGVGVIDNTFSAGGTVGARFNLGDSFAIYGSGSLAALLLTVDGAPVDAVPVIVPTSNGQLGISCTF